MIDNTLMQGVNWQRNSSMMFIAAPLGAAIGGGLALGYTILAILVMVFGQGVTWAEEQIASLVIMSITVLPVGLILAGIPSCFIGLLTGTALGYIVSHWKKHLTPLRSVLVGLAISLGFVSVGHWIAWLVFGEMESPGMSIILEPPFGSLNGYLFWLGLPSLIYLVANGCYSYILYELERRVIES